MSKKQMNASVKSIVVLLAICLVVAVAMAAIHQVTAPKIEEASRKAEQEALRAVLSEATEFLPVEGEYAPSVSALYRDAGGAGYAVLLSAKGYDASNPIKLAAGFDADGKILCLSVISCSGETSGIGTKDHQQFYKCERVCVGQRKLFFTRKKVFSFPRAPFLFQKKRDIVLLQFVATVDKT